MLASDDIRGDELLKSTDKSRARPLDSVNSSPGKVSLGNQKIKKSVSVSHKIITAADLSPRSQQMNIEKNSYS